MPLNDWSDDIVIAELADEPQFSEELGALIKRVEGAKQNGTLPSVVVDMKDISFLNSSSIAQLLQLRQILVDGDERLVICSAHDPVWSMMLVTGLDKVFEFHDNVAMALASLQIEEGAGG